MKLPFILQQHEKDHSQLKELRKEEIDFVSGARIQKLSTITVTPDGDGGDDGNDAN